MVVGVRSGVGESSSILGILRLRYQWDTYVEMFNTQYVVRN